MAESTVVKVAKDGTITITDGTGTPLTYTTSYEDGDFTFTDPKPERLVIRDRGTIAGLRTTNQQVGSLSFSVHMRNFANANSTTTLLDVINFTNNWSSAVSTGGTGYEPNLVNITFTVEGTDLGDAADHTVTFTKVHLEADFAEGDPNKINVTGEVYGTVTRTGEAAP